MVDEETDDKVVDKVDEEVVVEKMELRRLGKIFMQLSKNKFYYKQTFSSKASKNLQKKNTFNTEKIRFDLDLIFIPQKN